MPPRILGVIPARFASSRFPGKALALIAGKPMLQHVFERASQARYLSKVIVATDDARIFAAAQDFRANVRMTRADHLSGTDRAAEIASSEKADLIVNIQGDEPLIDPDAIDAAALALIENPDVPMATLKKRIGDPREITNPNVVKVVTDRAGNALYFSRCPIPHVRHVNERAPLGGPNLEARSVAAPPFSESARATSLLNAAFTLHGGGENVTGRQQAAEPDRPAGSVGGPAHYKHIGLYVYRRAFLLGYSDLPVGPLETAECLEQLRALENGHRIHVTETEYDSLGVDTPEDLERVSSLFEVTLLR